MWKSKGAGDGGLNVSGRCRCLVDVHDAHHYLEDFSPELAASSRRTKMRTQRTKVHQAGESNDPEVPGVYNIAAVELEELVLDIWASKRGIGQMANQKAVG